MAWLPPELELGEEPELKPPELEPEFVELDPEFVGAGARSPAELGPAELEPAELEPEPAEPEPEGRSLSWTRSSTSRRSRSRWTCWSCVADPGRARASAPAVTTLATVTVVVVDRTLARPRSLAATAWRIPSFRRALLMSPILRSRT